MMTCLFSKQETIIQSQHSLLLYLLQPEPTSLIFFQRVIKITFVNNTEDQLKKLQQQNNNPPKWFYSGITVCLAQEVYLMLNE